METKDWLSTLWAPKPCVQTSHEACTARGCSPSFPMSETEEPFQELNAGLVNTDGDEATARITDQEFLQFRRKCRRFRVLVIGPRNAGKTTILERLTGDSIAKAKVKLPNGEIVRIIISDKNREVN